MTRSSLRPARSSLRPARSSLRPALPRRILILAAAGLITVLTGCEAGNDAPTQQWHQPTAGAEAVLHQISIRNVFILGAADNDTLAAGQSAGLYLALINTGPADRLTSITAPGTARRVTLPGGSISLPTQKAALLTGPAPKVILMDLRHPLISGSSVPVTLTFQDAGAVTLRVPVLTRAQYYSTYSPAPSPSARATGHKRAATRHPPQRAAGPAPSPSPG